MNQNQIIIQEAIKACIDKNAVNFASLFAEDGEIILSNSKIILKSEIEQITANYFSTLAYVTINVTDICIEGDKALVKWTWQDFNTLTGKENCHDNIISINFVSGLISRWQESS
jgi:uncharacterized protein (TIGR02246 family)